MGIRFYTRVGKRSGISMPWWMALVWFFILATIFVYAAAAALVVGAVILAFYLVFHVPVWIAEQRQTAKKAAADRDAIALFDRCTAQLEAGERPTPEERAELDDLASSVILSWRPGTRVETPLRNAAFRFTAALKESDAQHNAAR